MNKEQYYKILSKLDTLLITSGIVAYGIHRLIKELSYIHYTNAVVVAETTMTLIFLIMPIIDNIILKRKARRLLKEVSNRND